MLGVKKILQKEGYTDIISIFIYADPQVIKKRMLKKHPSKKYLARFDKDIKFFNEIYPDRLSEYDGIIENSGNIQKGVSKLVEIMRLHKRKT